MNDIERMAVLRDEQEERAGLGERCRSSDCKGKALVRVLWPGQTTLMCERCAGRAQKVAQAMGFELAAERLP